MFLDELNPQEKKAFLELAFIVATIDGYMAPGEKILLEEYKKEMGIEEDYEIKKLPLEEILSHFESKRSKTIALTEILTLVFSDGVFDDRQRDLVDIIKKQFGFELEQFNSFKDWIEKIRELSNEDQSVGN